MNTADRWINNKIDSNKLDIKPTAIINGSYDIYQCPEHWMEKMWFTRIVFKLYHKTRNWIIINL